MLSPSSTSVQTVSPVELSYFNPKFSETALSLKQLPPNLPAYLFLKPSPQAEALTSTAQ